MADMDRGDAPASDDVLGRREAWAVFEQRLADHIATMAEEIDHLKLDSPGGFAPYESAPGVGIYGVAGGTRVDALFSGNCYLAEEFKLTSDQCEELEELGWTMHTTDEVGFWETDEPELDNWTLDGPRRESPIIARAIVRAFRDVVGVAHPQLLTQRGWGPAHEHVADLGLPDASAVPVEPLGISVPIAVVPADRDELRALIRETLAKRTDVEGLREVGDDLLFVSRGRQVRVHVRAKHLLIRISTRVAHDVRWHADARRLVGALNHADLYAKWTLEHDEIWQEAVLLGRPFAPFQLTTLLDRFVASTSLWQADVVSKVGGQPG